MAVSLQTGQTCRVARYKDKQERYKLYTGRVLEIIKIQTLQNSWNSQRAITRLNILYCTCKTCACVCYENDINLSRGTYVREHVAT